MNVRSEVQELQYLSKRHAVDKEALQRFLSPIIPELAGDFTIAKFTGGQSNPTYRLDGDGASFVLRRKPLGSTFASAHQVGREARVMRALGAVGFPVPRILASCDDSGVIGSDFYVMEYLDGRIFWDSVLAAQAPSDRRAIYMALVDTLADLHAVNIDAAGLSDFGPRGNYYARQVDRWAAQYRTTTEDAIPKMEELIAWLSAHIPTDDTVTLVHGDYRLDNVVFHKDRPDVIGVIDWELATLGNPIADLSYLLLNWIVPLNPSGGASLAGSDLKELGIPTADEVTDRYFGRSRLQPPANFSFHHTYNLFRLAAILHGIAARHRAGNAASDRADRASALISPLVNVACDLIGI